MSELQGLGKRQARVFPGQGEQGLGRSHSQGADRAGVARSWRARDTSMDGGAWAGAVGKNRGWA